mgnify:CR=1 FL=1
MSEEAVGFIILGVNGDEYDCASFSTTKTTGNRPIATMNRTRGNLEGFALSYIQENL